MEKISITKFIESMLPVVLEAGQFAMDQQGQVQNIGKDIELRSYDNSYVRQREQAKTVVDEKVQEKLLAAANAALGQYPVRIDAEEETQSTKLFNSHDADTTLVIDPIDGTLQYLKGSKEYSINMALVSKGSVLMAIQYFPAHKALYLLDVDGKPYRCLCDESGIGERQPLVSPPVVKGKSIYVNHRVPEQECLSQTFEVIKDSDGIILWTEAFFSCIAGTYKAALFLRPQIRDVILGAMIEAMPGGYAVDFKGNKIVWPDGGRVQEVIFGFGTLPDEIKNCLKEKN